MKRLLLLLLAVGAMVSLLSGCQKTDDSKPVEPEKEFPDITTDFAFEVTDVTPLGASVKFTPTDMEQTYYFSVMPVSDYRAFKTDEELFEAHMTFFQSIAEQEGVSLNEFLQEALLKGEQTWDYSALMPGTEYILYAYGLSTDGRARTAVNRTTFFTAEFEAVTCEFDIKASDITKTSFHLTVTPTSNDCSYYFDILDETGWQSALDGNPANLPTFMDGYIAELCATHNKTKVEVWAALSSYGKEELQVNDLYQGDTYYVFAIGISPDGSTTTEPFVLPVTTEREKPNTFAVTTNYVTQDAASFTIKPERMHEPFLTVIDLAENYKGASDNVIVSAILGTYNLNAILHSNEFTITTTYDGNYDQILIPGKEYYLMTFGYDGVQATTPVNKESFTTPAATSYDCSFTINVRDIMKNTASFSAIPSNKNTPFFFNCIKESTYNQLGGNDDALKQDAKREELARYNEEETALSMEEWRANNLFRDDFSGGFTDLMHGTTYYIYAIGMAADGSFTTAPYLSSSFKTVSGETSLASLDFKAGETFDNGDGTNRMSMWITPKNHDYMLVAGVADDAAIYNSSESEILEYLKGRSKKYQYVQSIFLNPVYGGKAYYFAAAYDKAGIPLVMKMVVDSPDRGGKAMVMTASMQPDNTASRFTQDAKPVVKVTKPATTPVSIEDAKLRFGGSKIGIRDIHSFSIR